MALERLADPLEEEHPGRRRIGAGERSTRAEARGGQSILRRLTPDEAHAVLTRLLAVHVELVPEAGEIAKALIAEVSFDGVADEVGLHFARRGGLGTP